MQGEMIGEYVAKNFDAVDKNKDGKISYILFKGEEGNNEAIYRTQYAVEDADKVLKEEGKPALSFYDGSNPNKYLVDKNGQWSAAAANEYMTTALTSYNEANNNMIELVICNNDGMAEGAVTALIPPDTTWAASQKAYRFSALTQQTRQSPLLQDKK